MPANLSQHVQTRTIDNEAQNNPVIESVPSQIYEEITQWRRNIFKLPKGNNGKQYVRIMTKLIGDWISTNEEDKLKLLMCMPNLLLQRTSRKGKARENKDTLSRRLTLWEDEKYEELAKEGKTLQRRLKIDKPNKDDDAELIKSFRNNMISGKVNAALRLLDKTSCKGVLPMTPDTMTQLLEKHPQAEPAHDEMILKGPMNEVNPIIFDDLNAQLVQKMSLKTKGAAGPSCFDADDWRNVLGTRIYGDATDDLCSAIAQMAKKLCVENRTLNGGVTALAACRLIPLDKDPGLRPIGIGEVLRRIIGKMVVHILKPDLQDGAGELQMCVGQEGGCEAGVHAMADMFEEQDTHGIIQVDANNAFNVINRNVFLHNIQIICPTTAIFIRNFYLKPARLFVVGGVEIPSAEGTTQGDPTTMPTYAIGIRPLLICLAQGSDTLSEAGDVARQAAYADDLAGCGTIDQ